MLPPGEAPQLAARSLGPQQPCGQDIAVGSLCCCGTVRAKTLQAPTCPNPARSPSPSPALKKICLLHCTSSPPGLPLSLCLWLFPPLSKLTHRSRQTPLPNLSTTALPSPSFCFPTPCPTDLFCAPFHPTRCSDTPLLLGLLSTSPTIPHPHAHAHPITLTNSLLPLPLHMPYTNPHSLPCVGLRLWGQAIAAPTDPNSGHCITHRSVSELNKSSSQIHQRLSLWEQASDQRSESGEGKERRGEGRREGRKKRKKDENGKLS